MRHPAPFSLIIAAAAVLLFAAALTALVSGHFAVPLQDVFPVLKSLFTADSGVSETVRAVVLNVRLPRILLAILAGGSLAAAGAAFQALFGNPLATPDTLGVATASAFGAALAILLGLGGWLLQGAALLSGLAGVCLVIAVSQIRGRSSLLMLILSGLVISAFFSALISLTKYIADPQDVLPTITFWLMGSMTGASMKSLALGAPLILAGSVFLYAVRWKLNALSLPEDEARALGIPVTRLRLSVILAATAVTASVVSMCGLIGWVGLLVPHFARLLLGSNNARVVPASLLLGALFVLVADTAARCAWETEVPVSILTALIGAPVFIALMRRSGGIR